MFQDFMTMLEINLTRVDNLSKKKIVKSWKSNFIIIGEHLEIWKPSARLCAGIKKDFTNTKDFGFKDRITRSGLSITSNIAEGYEEKVTKKLWILLTIQKVPQKNKEHKDTL